MFHVPCISYMHEICYIRPTNALGFMNVRLLHSDHRHVSAPYVAILRVVRTSVEITPKLRIVFLLKCAYFILILLFYCSTVNFNQKSCNFYQWSDFDTL